MDEAVRRFRPIIFAIAAMAFPVFLLSYFYAIKMLYQALPMWAFVLVCLSHITVFVGMSCLDDYRQERR